MSAPQHLVLEKVNELRQLAETAAHTFAVSKSISGKDRDIVIAQVTAICSGLRAMGATSQDIQPLTEIIAPEIGYLLRQKRKKVPDRSR